MTIDTNFKFYTDSNGGDPDLKSPTLRRYHRILWSKELPDGTKVFGKTINEEPEKYFTKDLLDQLEVAAAREFKYGQETKSEDESIETTQKKVNENRIDDTESSIA